MIVTLHKFRQNNPLIFMGIDLDSNPKDFLDVCNRLCLALECSLARVVELTSLQFQGVVYGWYETLPKRNDKSCASTIIIGGKSKTVAT